MSSNRKRHWEEDSSEEVQVLYQKKKVKVDVKESNIIDSRMQLTRIESLQAQYNENTVTLASLLSKKKSTNIIQFNFLLDFDWFMSQVPVHSRNDAKILFIHGMNDEFIPASSQLYPNTRFLSPLIPIPYGSHHTKAMILFYDDDTMQVIIHTANLIPGDWEYKTQAVWSSPFLRKKSEEYIKSGKECQFEKELCKYIKYYNIPVLNRLVERISLYNFEECKAILISSVPGIHKGNDMNKWGHLMLKNILESKFNMRLNEEDEIMESYIIAQMSSIGSLGNDDRWLNKEFGQSLRYSKKGTDSKTNIKLIYPTVDNVRNSLEGWNGGDCLPFSNNNWEKQSSYMSKILNIWKADNSGRTRAMPHIKTYTRIDDEEISWFLLTSANLSKAAWGALQKQGTQLMIRNYELGVLVLPELFSENENEIVKIINYYEKSKVKSAEDNETKAVTVPIPFDLPLTSYPPKSASNDPNTNTPWTCDTERDEPDLFGNKYIIHRRQD